MRAGQTQEPLCVCALWRGGAGFVTAANFFYSPPHTHST